MDAPFVSQMMTGARLSAAEPPAETGLVIRARLKDADEESEGDDGEDVVIFGDVDDDSSGEGVRYAGGAETKSDAGFCAAVGS